MKLVISDLHLTDNINDEYRWSIFNWLEQQIDINNLLIYKI